MKIISCVTDLNDPDAKVPLPNVTGRILAKVIEYAKFHTDAKSKKDGEKQSKTDDDIKTFDNEFVKVDQGTLFELILVRLPPSNNCAFKAAWSKCSSFKSVAGCQLLRKASPADCYF